MSLKLGRDFRCRMQEEAHGRNVRCDGEFVSQSRIFEEFCREGLALEPNGIQSGMNENGGTDSWPEYRRIPGKQPQVTFEDVSLFDLASETLVNRQTGEPVGRLFVHEFMDPSRCSSDRYTKIRSRFRETGEASSVDWSMFAGITGPMLYNEVLKGWESEEFVFSRMAGTYPTQFIAGERVPGVSVPVSPDALGLDLGQVTANNNTTSTANQYLEDVLLKRPGKEFARATMGENYIDLPPTDLRGLIIDVDRTSIYTDRTGLIAGNAKEIGQILGKRKEIRGILLLTGIDAQVANGTFFYKEKYLWDKGPVQLDLWQGNPQYTANGYAFQQAAQSPGRKFPFYNDVPNNPFNDYETFVESDLWWARIVDPNDGWPLTLTAGQDMFFPHSQRFDVARITQAYQVYQISQGLVSGGAFGKGSIMTASPNPLVNTLGRINVQTSRLLSQVMLMSTLYSIGGASSKVDPELVWFTGDFKESIKYAENWPIKVIQRPPLSEAEFLQDVVLGYRADERGRWVIWNPRKLQRNNFISQGTPTEIAAVPGE